MTSRGWFWVLHPALAAARQKTKIAAHQHTSLTQTGGWGGGDDKRKEQAGLRENKEGYTIKLTCIRQERRPKRGR